MKIKDAEKIALLVMVWCAGAVGKSKYHNDYPIVFTEYQLRKNDKCFGEYDFEANVMFIFTRTNQTILQLINTVIHEYMHYMQCPEWISRYIGKYKRNVEKNPYEIVASSIANSLYKMCEKDLRTQIKIILRKGSYHSKIKK